MLLNLRLLGLFVCLGVSLVATTGAQSRLMVEAPGTWKAWKFTAVPSARQESGITAAELKAFEGQLVGLNAILQRAPGVATPRGFSVETWGFLSGYRSVLPGQPKGSAAPIAGGLDFGAFPIFEYERDGRTIRADTGETELLVFQVNDFGAGIIAGERVPDFLHVNDQAYLEPPAKGEIEGFPRFGNILIIKKNPASIWAPVPMADAIGLILASRRQDLDDARATVERVKVSLADLQNPAKKAERFLGFKVAAAAQPDAAKFLAEMEQVEREVAATHQKDLSPEGSTMARFLEVERAIADTAAWLGELSTADRSAQACYVQSGATHRQRFRAGVAPGCVPVVKPNWAFFDARLPRSAPQVVVVLQISRCFDDQPAQTRSPAGCPANRQLLSTWDRQAVLDWLK